jgi:hypothetical protein
MPAHGGERMAKCFLLAPLVNGDRAANPLKTLTLCENPRAQGAEHAVRMADGASCQPAVAQRRMPCLDVEAAYLLPRWAGNSFAFIVIRTVQSPDLLTHFSTFSCQTSAEHFQQCAEFLPLRNCGLGPLAVTVLPVPLTRREDVRAPTFRHQFK